MTDLETPTQKSRRLSPSVQFIERFLEIRSSRLSGLLLGKLDAFNRISTTFGAERAEEFCAEYVQKLRTTLPPSTPIVLLSDRRFAVLVGLHSIASIVDLATQIAEDRQPQMRVGDDTFLVDVTIGIAVYPTHADDAATLFRRAELALREAHENELTFEIYQPDATAQQAALWKFESDLECAVAQGALEVYYQPKLALQKPRVCGVEALVRWRHASGRLIGPDEFIPLAERAGSIVPISWLVFDAVAAMSDTWAGLEKPFSVAINISPQVLCHDEFFTRIESLSEMLSAHGVDLTMELTEDNLLESDTTTSTRLAKLKQLGIDLSIDDFGKGHSALTYLKDVPADEIKVDKRFIGTLATDEKDRHIVQAVVSLAHAFGMRVVAEGVDNEHSLEVICALGCEQAQGFYFSRPIRGDLLKEWIASFADGSVTKLIRPAGLKLTGS